jgi:pyruvate dehydrogenase E1 component alpha subunit
LLDASALDGVDAQVADLIEAAVTEAKAAPTPTGADLTTDVYVSY